MTETTTAVCAWCEKESGERPEARGDVLVTHTVCARHFCMTLLQGRNIPAQLIKDRAVRMYGVLEGMVAFDTAVLVLSRSSQTQKV